MINHRIYVSLEIPKSDMPFILKNQGSTANYTTFRSVTFILTRNGVLSIQGADDNLINTLTVRKIFDIIVE